MIRIRKANTLIMLFLAMALLVTLKTDVYAETHLKKGTIFYDTTFKYKVIKEGANLKVGSVQIVGINKQTFFGGPINITNYARFDETYETFLIKSIKGGVFRNNKKIREVSIACEENVLTQIPANCFRGCSNIKSISLVGVPKISANAFRGCNNVERIYMRHTPKVGKNAFKGVGTVILDCSAATRVTYESTYKKVGRLLKKGGVKKVKYYYNYRWKTVK